MRAATHWHAVMDLQLVWGAAVASNGVQWQPVVAVQLVSKLGAAVKSRRCSAHPTHPLQDGTITKKNSPARNVHRLLNTLNFIAAIFENLAKGMTLKVGGMGVARALWACCLH